jgi:membrane dipeptidase
LDTAGTADRQALEQAQRIHREHIVIDSMAPSFIAEWVVTPPMVELGKQMQAEGRKRSAIQAALADYLIEHCESDAATRAAYLEYWRRAGVTACNNTLYASGPPDSAWDSLIREFGRAGRLVNALGGAVVQANSAADIERAHRDGKRAVFYNVQNPEPLGDQLGRVDTLYGLGLRAMQLTYNLRSRFADGCLEKNDGGLSRLGEALVHKMNERRMMLDVSHASVRTAAEVTAASGAPIIASHTAAHAISGHARAFPDAVLKGIAERGGYIGVLIPPPFVLPPAGDARAAKAGAPAGWATLDTVADHVLHILGVAGADHVGIGTDWGKPYYNSLAWTAEMVNEPTAGFDWVGWRPQDKFDPNMQVLGMETWDKWHNLTAALLRRGIPEATVVKIVGGNFLRVFRDICG